jgi:hypothetical protein
MSEAWTWPVSPIPAIPRDTAHFVLVMKDIQNLLHKRLLPAVIRFAQIDSDNGNLRFHGTPPTSEISSDVGAAEGC